MDHLTITILITTRKRSLGQGNIFAPVCHSVHKGGVCPIACWDSPPDQRQVHPRDQRQVPPRPEAGTPPPRPEAITTGPEAGTPRSPRTRGRYPRHTRGRYPSGPGQVPSQTRGRLPPPPPDQRQVPPGADTPPPGAVHAGRYGGLRAYLH